MRLHLPWTMSSLPNFHFPSSFVATTMPLMLYQSIELFHSDAESPLPAVVVNSSELLASRVIFASLLVLHHRSDEAGHHHSQHNGHTSRQQHITAVSRNLDSISRPPGDSSDQPRFRGSSGCSTLDQDITGASGLRKLIQRTGTSSLDACSSSRCCHH